MTPKRRVIPVFVPHLGCPHDCVFCNQRRISGEQEPATAETVRAAAESYPGTACELAFYGGSFTAIPAEQQEDLLEAAQDFLKMDPANTLRLSTRPDAIDEGVIARLKKYGVKTVELGVQSMHPQVLTASNRGHTAEDAERSARMLKDAGFEVILQMMTGLPGDTPERSVYTAEKLISLAPDGVRIYPTVIVRDTALSVMHRRGSYTEHTVEDAVSVCSMIVPMFEKAGIPIIRLGLNPTEELSSGAAEGGAYHPALGELVYSRIWLGRARGLFREYGAGERVVLGVAPGCVSIMVGQRRCNTNALKSEFGIKDLKVRETDVKRGEIVILSIENKPL